MKNQTTQEVRENENGKVISKSGHFGRYNGNIIFVGDVTIETRELLNVSEMIYGDVQRKTISGEHAESDYEWNGHWED